MPMTLRMRPSTAFIQRVVWNRVMAKANEAPTAKPTPVTNTADEIRQAMMDCQSGKF